MNNIEYYLSFIQYNSFVVLTFFFLSLIVLVINTISKNKINKLLFSSYRSSLVNPLTYLRLFTHVLGHANWSHFMNNFLYILLIGPMIEEKYGSLNLFYMILITAGITGLINSLRPKNISILGASNIVFMMIVLSSFVNIQAGKIPLTLILICLCYVVNEIIDGLCKKDDVSHLGHLVGACCGLLFGFYF